MQTTDDAERKYHVQIPMGHERVRTRLTYTREQAKEINDLVVKSAKLALEYDEIIPGKPEGEIVARDDERATGTMFGMRCLRL